MHWWSLIQLESDHNVGRLSHHLQLEMPFTWLKSWYVLNSLRVLPSVWYRYATVHRKRPVSSSTLVSIYTMESGWKWWIVSQKSGGGVEGGGDWKIRKKLALRLSLSAWRAACICIRLLVSLALFGVFCYISSDAFIAFFDVLLMVSHSQSRSVTVSVFSITMKKLQQICIAFQ